MNLGGEWWVVQLPLAEATMLTSAAGPFFDSHGYARPGQYRHDGTGRVLLDRTAVGSLSVLGDDFRVTETNPGVFQMLIGRDKPYPVLPAAPSERVAGNGWA